MKNIFFSLIVVLTLHKLNAQKEYLGLEASQLSLLEETAQMRQDYFETEKIRAYQDFFQKIEKLQQAFSSKLVEEGLSEDVEREIRKRLDAIDALPVYSRAYRSARISGDADRSEEQFEEFMKALETLELSDYFMELQMNNGSVRSERSVEKQISYYLLTELNYSFVSIEPENNGFIADYTGSGGASYQFSLGAERVYSQKYSAFIELGLGRHNFSYSGASADGFYEREVKFLMNYTDLSLGAKYQIGKLKTQLGISLLFSGGMDVTDRLSVLGMNNESSLTENEILDVKSSRLFLNMGASYPFYSFALSGREVQLSARLNVRLALSKINDEDVLNEYLNNNLEKLSNSQLNMGLGFDF